MHVVFGGRALSAFRRERLRRRVVDAVPGLELVDARFVYACAGWSEEEAARARLEALLAEGYAGPPPDPSALGLFVFPRFGTISPWSSKAGDILADCGLAEIGRVERGLGYALAGAPPAPESEAWRRLGAVLADRMTETMVASLDELAGLFRPAELGAEYRIALGADGEAALLEADARLGLSLGAAERAYLLDAYRQLGRDPTETELMMFAQVNSEHCRHKIFRGRWTLDDALQERSPFDCIRESYRASPGGILSAYRDNAAVLAGAGGAAWVRAPTDGVYADADADASLDIAIKVETHNHPTGVAPYPGAATGAGGEIRDETAVGRGGSPKAGLTGFAVSDLRLPGAERPWETAPGTPPGMASALEIMLEAPIGAAGFNNEFGRPAVAGFFRSFCRPEPGAGDGRFRGYHKPVMLAGGLGAVRRDHVAKLGFGPGTRIVVLGGPAMQIGLGGGAASSRATGKDAELDFASVQRGNPEMQRRAQEVIETAIALGADNPILAIHDVGAGGLSNAIPELLHDAGLGGRIDLARVPSAEPGMSPAALWCNEAQERYVIALAPEREPLFAAICAQERCPWAVVGEATAAERLLVADGRRGEQIVVDLPMSMLLGELPPLAVTGVSRGRPEAGTDDSFAVEVSEALERVLAQPGVGDKGFLITIGDRTVGGMISRDQLAGPWQVGVADAAVTLADYRGRTGEALALGERMPVAVSDAAASARLAVGEALTNIAAAGIAGIADVRLSANWMAAAGEAGDNADLYAAVRAVGAELCPRLGVAIPVGKDSLSMRVAWREPDGAREVRSPLTLVVTAFAPVSDAAASLTPVLAAVPDTELWLLDLGGARNRLGGSVLAQVFGRDARLAPDLDDPDAFKNFFAAVRELAAEGVLLAYHDRSDGGLAVTLVEMALAGHRGIDVDVSALGADPVAALFSEELGAVVQIRRAARARFEEAFAARGIAAVPVRLGTPREDAAVVLRHGRDLLYSGDWPRLMRRWAEVSYRMRALRDDPDCAREEYDGQCDPAAPGLGAARLSFDPALGRAPSSGGRRPRVAILRAQGVNGHRELAAAFDRAGFEAVDVHMSQLGNGSRSLADHAGLAVPGGFSYGDVLGAGRGWAQSIRHNPRLREEFENFLARRDRFALGVCNGCQMLAALSDLIPGAAHWPQFRRNRSEQFEARLALVEVLDSVSPFFDGMSGSLLPVAVAHGEGRAAFERPADLDALLAGRRVPLRYATGPGRAAERYPENPNGSPGGATAFANEDGRVLILMPHPERVFRGLQHSWYPEGWPEDGPWLRLFDNMRRWAG